MLHVAKLIYKIFVMFL